VIDRRAFISGASFVLLAAPLAAEAQQVGKVPRIGVIRERSPTDRFLEAFRQGLRELGYAEGRRIVIEYRYAHGVVDRFSDLAAELIRLKVDVLLVGGTSAARSAKAQTTTVPIVFAVAGDPVGSGLVASLARPGGNVTGITALSVNSALSGKQFELLKAAVPQVSRVAVLYNPANPAAGSALDGTREVARALAVELQALEVRRPNQLESAFSTLTAWRAGALLAFSDPVFGSDLVQLSKLAAKNRLPAMYARREFAEAGGLLAYGASFSDNYRLAAVYVDKILKGAKPADLPVEQPTKFELIINMKTARTLGLTIPQSLLLRADQVIE
jgi:putative ABC transport system substrate-binding protein